MNVRIEFAYEPILFTRTGAVTPAQAVAAYEQLARLPGGRDANWLADLDREQRALLDAEACLLAERVVRKKRVPVFVNCFPENLDVTAYTVHDNPHLALEAHQDAPVDAVERLAREYRRLWLVLDDVTDRQERFARLLSSEWLPRKPLWVKLPVDRAENTLYGASADLDLGANLPRAWTVIQEGVRPDELIACWCRGMLYAQGRSLSGGFRAASDLALEVPVDLAETRGRACAGSR